MEGSLNGSLAPPSRPGLHGESRGQLMCLLLCSEAAAQTKLGHLLELIAHIILIIAEALLVG